MIRVFAKERGLEVGTDITATLGALLADLAKTPEEKTVVFEDGTYLITAENAVQRKLFVTNTVGDEEWKRGEEPHLVRVGICLENMQNLTLLGQNTTFLIRGQMTNIALIGCKNIALQGIKICTENPDLHRLEVVRVGKFFVDFLVDSTSKYQKSGGFAFVGEGYRTRIFAHRTAGWIGKVSARDSNRINRTKHPLLAALCLREIAPRTLRAYYLFRRKCEVGEQFYLFDVRRKYVGIFVDKCANIRLKNIEQTFNYSLSFVAQDSENLYLDGLRFAPDEGRLVTSVADFMQFCMCKGQIEVKNSYFEGACDDCLNVHGVHYMVTNIQENRLTVRYSHPQTHGFNPLHEGDAIEYIDSDTLLTRGGAQLLQSKMLDENHIELTVSGTEGCAVGCAIEDITMCPDLTFCNNTVNRIITRGLLVTTRGRVLIQNNRFINTASHAILHSNDAKSWFESGRVEDVTISGNSFENCGGYGVFIFPENPIYAGAVHKNITVSGNTFGNTEGDVYAKYAQNVHILGNKRANGDNLRIENQNSEIVEG